MSHSLPFHARALAISASLFTAATVVVMVPGASLASSNLRQTFPGRRVGGGTRGSCSSRLIAHLVPTNSVFSPGKARFLGVLEGPSPSPSRLQLTFRPLNDKRTPASPPAVGQSRVLPASEPGITIVSLPALKAPMVWESSYLCQQATTSAGPSAPLDFVATESPPALSLLLQDTTSDDTTVQAELRKLHKFCGSSIPRAQVRATFDLADLITDEWPERIPVRCPA